MREKLIELLNNSFEKQYEKRGLLTAPHTAEDLIANGVTVTDNNVGGKWIPVTERLPEVDTPVLTYRETGQNVELLWQRGCEKRWDYDEFTPYPVTHWMPLPEPPKGE